jgi:hypothetical protein
VSALRRGILWVYHFVVGDPIMLWGGLASLALAALLRPLGPLDGVILFVCVCVVVALSLHLRPD